MQTELLSVLTVCACFYADYKTLENYITRAQMSPLANEIMLTISRITTMTGDIRPTDITAADVG